MIGANLHSGSAFDDVIHLIFAVRFLGIDAAFRQNVDASAHGLHASEFQVALAAGGALAVKVVNVEEVRHGNSPCGDGAAARFAGHSPATTRELKMLLSHRAVEKNICVLAHQGIPSQWPLRLVPLINPI